MTYTSIFTAITDEKTAKQQIAQAADVARQLDAHLDVLCLGIDRNQSGFYYGGASAIVIQDMIDRSREEAQSLVKLTEAALEGEGLRFATEAAVVPLGDIAHQIGIRARFSDLCVLSSPYSDEQSGDQEAILEGAILDGKVPVFVPQSNAAGTKLPSKPILAWDESDQALSAARAALPILKAAGSVRVVVIDPPVHSANRSDPGGILSQYLSRHGIRCEIDVLGKSMPRIADVMLRHAADCEADGIIMGAYGHSRLREAIFGGATRDMLQNGTVPLFMAH